MTFDLSIEHRFPVHPTAPEGFLPYTSSYSVRNEYRLLKQAVSDAHLSGQPFALVGNERRITLHRKKFITYKDNKDTQRKSECTHIPKTKRTR